MLEASPCFGGFSLRAGALPHRFRTTVSSLNWKLQPGLFESTALPIGHVNGARLSGDLVVDGDIQVLVCVDIEGDFDLRNTKGSGLGNSRELNCPEKVVLFDSGMLVLVNLNEHTRLVVSIGGKDFRPLGRDYGISLDEGVHDATDGFDTEGAGDNVEQEYFPQILSDAYERNCSRRVLAHVV